MQLSERSNGTTSAHENGHRDVKSGSTHIESETRPITSTGHQKGQEVKIHPTSSESTAMVGFLAVSSSQQPSRASVSCGKTLDVSCGCWSPVRSWLASSESMVFEIRMERENEVVPTFEGFAGEGVQV